MTGELQRHAPGARSTLQRELQCLGTRFDGLVLLYAKALQPVGHEIQVVVLTKWIEREP